MFLFFISLSFFNNKFVYKSSFNLDHVLFNDFSLKLNQLFNFFNQMLNLQFFHLLNKNPKFHEFIHKHVELNENQIFLQEFDNNQTLNLFSSFSFSNCFFKSYSTDYAISTNFDIYFDSCLFDEIKVKNNIIQTKESKSKIEKTIFYKCLSSSQNSLIHSYFSPYFLISLCSYSQVGCIEKTCFNSDQSLEFVFQSNNVSYSESQISSPIGSILFHKTQLSYCIFSNLYTRGDNCGLTIIESNDFSCFNSIFNQIKSESQSNSIINVLSSNNRNIYFVGSTFNDFTTNYVFYIQSQTQKLELFNCLFSSSQEKVFFCETKIDIVLNDCKYQYQTNINNPITVNKELLYNLIRNSNKQKQNLKNIKNKKVEDDFSNNLIKNSKNMIFFLISILILSLMIGLIGNYFIFSKNHFFSKNI